MADEVHVTKEGSRTIVLTGIRSRADGSTQEVNIEIRDNGPGANEHRWPVDIYSDGIEPNRGNPDATLSDALSNADAHSSGLG